MKSKLHNLVKPIGTALIVATIFVAYMIVVGIPKTRAAAYYNLAVQQEGLGALKRADEYYKKSIESFPEGYIIQQYKRFQETK